MINRRSLLEGIKNQFYILEWLPDYQKQDFLADLKSGITVGMIEVPQVMAYAVIAGLSPIYGLYGSLIPLLIRSEERRVGKECLFQVRCYVDIECGTR